MQSRSSHKVHDVYDDQNVYHLESSTRGLQTTTTAETPAFQRRSSRKSTGKLESGLLREPAQQPPLAVP